jgi:uncharacterized protein YjbI with pentapeptide repeats
MIPLTHDLKEKIQTRIKNKLDISDLIKDVDLKGADLTGAVINNIQITKQDISGCNFTNTVIGNDKTICTLIQCNLTGCSFKGAQIVGRMWIRSCIAHNCNFKDADVSKVEYQYTDFTDSTFCNAVIRIGTREGIGCIFPTQMFDDLCKGWRMKIKAEILP